MRDRAREQQRERELRFGLDRDPLEEHQHELELTERIAEQASLPTSHPLVVAAVRHRLGRGRSPYEHAHQPEPRRLAAGDEVSHFGPHGPRPGVVVRTLDDEGLVEVELEHSTTLVPLHEVERRAA